ncbi:RIP metalloprotease RseP [bacterium]|nr:RIP metalloprotease RseP [bacterium]
MDIIIFLIVLLVLIVSHEFGHFITAKKAGVRVDEFGIGFPPRIASMKKGETEYTLNALPFGGFVKIFGEDPDEVSKSGPESSRSLVNQPKYIQAAVIAAGVFFNILLAWILISGGYMAGLPSGVENAPAGARIAEPELTLVDVLPDSPAEDAGLKIGDRIMSVAAEKEMEENLDPEALQNFIGRHGDDEIHIAYRRGSEEGVAVLTPVLGIVEEKPAIGIAMDMIGIATLPPHRAFFEGAKLTWNLTDATVRGYGSFFKQIFMGDADLSQVTGPVGIVGLVGDASDFGFTYLLSFTAFISINLAVINLLPFPALDGGRLLFLAIEAVRRRPIPHKVSNTVNAAGFALLLLLMLIVTYRDILNIFEK